VKYWTVLNDELGGEWGQRFRRAGGTVWATSVTSGRTFPTSWNGGFDGGNLRKL